MQLKWSIWHSTPETCSSCGQWFLLWMVSSKFVLPLSAKSGKRLKMKRKLWMACKKAKVNVNMDCFSLIKGQWKLFKGQWKVGEFLTFWKVAALIKERRWREGWGVIILNIAIKGGDYSREAINRGTAIIWGSTVIICNVIPNHWLKTLHVSIVAIR